MLQVFHSNVQCAQIYIIIYV